MALMVYNTLTHRKQAFETLEPGLATMYVCGPTVYDHGHVGHAMSSLVFDVIRRYLEHKGYRVKHVMNYTDVDDKVINRATELGVDALELAEQHINEYAQHIDDLNILPADVYPRVSQEIDFIIDMVQSLIDSGHAYSVDGDVYFRVSSDADYGKLSGRRQEEMQAGARLEVDPRKEDPADFALWKSSKPGEPKWDSPWGPGRPGWHIECSAMSLHYLGEQIDIHGGGTDLIFPHHENEIAQTESLTGKPFASFWIHNGMLQFTGEKMSKSVGNVVTIREFLDSHEPDVLRMVVLNGSYRSPLVFNDDVVSQAEASLGRLRGALRAESEVEDGDTEAEAVLDAQVGKTLKGFEVAMDDDFNTAGALGHLFDLVRAINQARDDGAGRSVLNGAKEHLQTLGALLGLRLATVASDAVSASPFIDLLVEIRQDLRASGEYSLSDRIRDRLGELGVTIEDKRDASTWRLS